MSLHCQRRGILGPLSCRSAWHAGLKLRRWRHSQQEPRPRLSTSPRLYSVNRRGRLGPPIKRTRGWSLTSVARGPASREICAPSLGKTCSQASLVFSCLLPSQDWLHSSRAREPKKVAEQQDRQDPDSCRACFRSLVLVRASGCVIS